MFKYQQNIELDLKDDKSMYSDRDLLEINNEMLIQIINFLNNNIK